MIKKEISLLVTGESLSDLDRRSNQLQLSLKPKSNPKMLTLFNSMKAERSEKAAEEKFEASGDWLMRLKEEAISIT